VKSEDGTRIILCVDKLLWTGKEYKGVIGAWRTEKDRLAKESFASLSGDFLVNSINKATRKLAAKLDIDLTPINKVTF
jgi:hypothetical protein